MPWQLQANVLADGKYHGTDHAFTRIPYNRGLVPTAAAALEPLDAEV